MENAKPKARTKRRRRKGEFMPVDLTHILTYVPTGSEKLRRSIKKAVNTGDLYPVFSLATCV